MYCPNTACILALTRRSPSSSSSSSSPLASSSSSSTTPSLSSSSAPSHRRIHHYCVLASCGKRVNPNDRSGQLIPESTLQSYPTIAALCKGHNTTKPYDSWHATCKARLYELHRHFVTNTNTHPHTHTHTQTHITMH
jgi:hypothetical protein